MLHGAAGAASSAPDVERTTTPPRPPTGSANALGRRRTPEVQTPTTKLTLVVPLPPMFNVWNVFASFTW